MFNFFSSEALDRTNGRQLDGREIHVVIAKENRKTPHEMRRTHPAAPRDRSRDRRSRDRGDRGRDRGDRGSDRRSRDRRSRSRDRDRRRYTLRPLSIEEWHRSRS